MGLSPAGLGIWMMLQGRIWDGVLVILVGYLLVGLVLGMWPLLALAWFAYGWYAGGFVNGLGCILTVLVFVALFSAPEWLMALAYREAVKASALQDTPR
jgi:hypothetical protein